MRHAVVVAPPGFEPPADGSVFGAAEPVGPLCEALVRGGHRMTLVAQTPELEADFERALGGIGEEDDLLVYVAGSTTTRSDAAVLRLVGEGAPSMSLRAMSDAVIIREVSSALFVIEAQHDGDADDPLFAAEHVDAIARALDVRVRGYGALVGVRAEGKEPAGSWPFTRHLLEALAERESRDETGAAPIERVYERLRAAQSIDTHVQSFAFVRGRAPFTLVDATSREPLAPVRTLPPPAPVLAPAREPVSLPIPISVSDVEPASVPIPISVSDAQPASVPIPISESPPEAAPASPSASESATSPTLATPSSPPPAIRYSSSRPPQLSMPSLDPLLALADGARERRAWEEALAGYKAALMVTPPDDTASRASIYARIGHVKSAQGKPREAELNFEKVLSMAPEHRESLDALVAIATAAKEHRRAIEWRRKRLRSLESPGARLGELLALARIHADDLADARGAAEALEEAHAIDPNRRDVLDGMRAAYEKLQRWPRVADTLAEIADASKDAKERAAMRFAAADVVLGRLREEDRGLALLELALEDDPTHDKALHALVAVRTSRNEWKDLDAIYTRLVERFAKLGDVDRAWDACRKLGTLRRDKLRDVSGAVEAFTGAASCKPADVDSRAMLAEMHLARGDESSAIAEFERIAHHAPVRASTYARLFSLHQRAGRDDRAWLVGLALEELGAADVDQQLFVDQFRSDGPIRPARSLDDEAWTETLRAPGADAVVADVLRAIVRAAAAARVEELRDARKLVTLDPARRQNAASTVSAVRSFQWAAQILGVDAPDLYVLDAVPGGIAAVQAPAPSTALGPGVLRGLGAKDLAFLAARHLTYYRPEHYALVHYPSLEEVSSLFLGAVKLAMPELPVPPNLSGAVARARKALGRHASDDERKKLAQAVERLDARDGRVDLAAWIKSVELSAQRAGLLLCGDLAVAMTRLRGEVRAIADLTLDQKRGDLLAFCASKDFARAREVLGVSVKPSVRPPPMTEAEAG